MPARRIAATIARFNAPGESAGAPWERAVAPRDPLAAGARTLAAWRVRALGTPMSRFPTPGHRGA